jgi:hypothetical protein
MEATFQYFLVKAEMDYIMMSSINFSPYVMQLRKFTLITPSIEVGEIFKVIESANPH